MGKFIRIAEAAELGSQSVRIEHCCAHHVGEGASGDQSVHQFRITLTLVSLRIVEGLHYTYDPAFVDFIGDVKLLKAGQLDDLLFTLGSEDPLETIGGLSVTASLRNSQFVAWKFTLDGPQVPAAWSLTFEIVSGASDLTIIEADATSVLREFYDEKFAS